MMFAQVRRQRSIARLLSTPLLVLALALGSTLVQADCSSISYDGGITLYWTCSGTINDLTIAGTTNNDVFRIEPYAQGRLTIQANGSVFGHDEINFFITPQNLTIDLSNQTSFQTIYAGLEIWFQGFVRASIVGGNGDDVLTGTSGDDLIQGTSGKDIIDGGAGNDIIQGGAHEDTLSGGEGDDFIQGQFGDDVILGGAGNDTLYGDEGNDSINGGDGNDLMTGGLEQDTFQGGDGLDTRADTIAPHCVGDTLASIEVDNCPALVIPPVPVVPTAAAPLPSDLCRTLRTRVALDDRGVLLIFSDFQTTPNGMMITEIPLRILRNPTDEEKAADAWVPLIAKDSEFAPGWSVGLYWHANHYGFQIFQNGTLFDDTDAICGWF